jgi:hypothetical protein
MVANRWGEKLSPEEAEVEYCSEKRLPDQGRAMAQLKWHEKTHKISPTTFLSR